MNKNPHLPGTPEEFITANLGLAHSTAWRFFLASRRDPTNKFDQDDFTSIAYLGLIKAYEKFDPTRFIGNDGGPIKFGSYAVPVIGGEIMRETRDRGRTIRGHRDGTTVYVDSLEQPVKGSENLTLGDLAQTGSYLDADNTVINDFLGQVGPRLRRIYELRTMGLSQTEIAKIFKLSQISISRMENYLYQSAERYGRGEEVGDLYRQEMRSAWGRKINAKKLSANSERTISDDRDLSSCDHEAWDEERACI